MTTVMDAAQQIIDQRQALRRAEADVEKTLRNRFDLTIPQFELLLTIENGNRLGDLADEMECSRGNLTGIADRLEEKELVERRRSTEDRRVVNLHLTTKGHALLSQIRAEIFDKGA